MAVTNNKINKEITTIKLEKETKTRLERLREHRRETYDDILKKMLGILNLARSEPEKAQSILNKIHKQLATGQKYTQVYEQEKSDIKEKRQQKNKSL